MLVFAIGWIARAVIYVALLAANWRFVDYSLMPVPKDFVRSERIVELLSFPYSPKGSYFSGELSSGTVSVFAWANIVHQAARQLFLKS